VQPDAAINLQTIFLVLEMISRSVTFSQPTSK